ncbi:MAG TPA: twin-arginine translocase TatA/TatE family subunit [Candidatus Krumholzibacteria bacterium]|nr:twin-arginine translocase TatA/TatE family subunit [Candidatus Krumholzibacteria bacterium]
MPCGRLGTSELLLIGLLVAVLFGASRLPEIGRGLGLGIKRFKRALHEDEDNIKKKELDDD